MANDNRNKLLHYLSSNTDWVKCKDLANYLAVSDRQIRKYITQINAEKKIVLSSPQGYRLNSALYSFNEEDNMKDNELAQRQSYILQKLMTNPNGYDVYDLADELFVSDSTINKDLTAVKNTLSNFKIDLKREKDIIRLDAKEKDMRKLMYNLVSNTSINDAFFTDDFSLFGLNYNHVKMSKDIKKIINDEGIAINDFALNNLLIHFIIILDRIKNGYLLKDYSHSDTSIELKYYHIAEIINQYAKQEFNCCFAKNEMINLALIISNNVNQNGIINYDDITLNTISNYVESRFIEITYDILQKTEENYFLPPFKDKFISKFILHIQNLFYRIKNDYAAKNPLTDKIKTSYPLIYDIAAFIAQELKNKYDLILNEDEIAFISFHIGAYFEENSFINQTQVNCAFIYSDYYDFYKITLEKLQNIFADKINFKIICPINDFYYPLYVGKIDLVIASTLSKGKIPEDKIAYIKPFLKDDDIQLLEKKISAIAYEKNKAELNDYILSFFNPKFFYKNKKVKDKYELIKLMCDDLLAEGYTDDNFYEDVIKREQISSTSFHDAAIPHAFSSSGTKRSFISIALYDDGINWGNEKNVKIIAMIGANKNSRKIFSQFFEQIISILDNPENVTALISSNNFGDFYNNIVKIFNE